MRLCVCVWDGERTRERDRVLDGPSECEWDMHVYVWPRWMESLIERGGRAPRWQSGAWESYRQRAREFVGVWWVHPGYLAWTRESYIVCERDLRMVYIWMQTRKTPHPTHTHKERERERWRERERDQQGFCVGCVRQNWRLSARERERERKREQESGRGGGRVLCIKDWYKLAFKYLNWRTCCLQSTHERIYAYIKQVH